MGYKKEKRGASLVVNHFDNQLNIVGNYFDKWVYHEINLDEKKTKIITGTAKYQYLDKPVVWRDKWLKTRFINCQQQIEHRLWFVDFNYPFAIKFIINLITV